VALVTLQELLDSGVHFGHQTRRWNPKMRRFILGERNGIYLIDLRKTLAGIETSYAYVRDLVADGGIILFVGTKKQTQGPIEDYAKACGMPFVNQRWLGGMLTNFATVAGRVKRMVELRGMQRAGDFENMPKREALHHSRELEKLDRNLSGISNLDRVPDAIFVIDTKKEHIAVTEARKLGLPVVAVVDTNCDPDVIDYVIPGNDDAIRAGALLCRLIADAVTEGRFIRANRPVITKNPSSSVAFVQAVDAEIEEPTPPVVADATPVEEVAHDVDADDVTVNEVAPDVDADDVTVNEDAPDVDADDVTVNEVAPDVDADDVTVNDVVIDDVANNASPDVAVSPVDVEATTDDIAPVVEVADAPAIN
jgi:small subunit ribosomal protein S2